MHRPRTRMSWISAALVASLVLTLAASGTTLYWAFAVHTDNKLPAAGELACHELQSRRDLLRAELEGLERLTAVLTTAVELVRDQSPRSFERNLRLEELVSASTPPPYPTTTAWQPFEPPGGMESSRADSPGQALVQLAGRLGLAGQLTVAPRRELLFRVKPDPANPDRATGLILTWGFGVAGEAGQDLLLDLARDDQGWYVTDIKQRLHRAAELAEPGGAGS